MINYEKNICTCDEVPQATSRATLTEMLNISRMVGNESLALAKLISNHLFGENKTDKSPKKEPACYMEAIEEHCETLKELHVVLQIVADALGGLR